MKESTVKTAKRKSLLELVVNDDRSKKVKEFLAKRRGYSENSSDANRMWQGLLNRVSAIFEGNGSEAFSALLDNLEYNLMLKTMGDSAMQADEARLDKAKLLEIVQTLTAEEKALLQSLLNRECDPNAEGKSQTLLEKLLKASDRKK